MASTSVRTAWDPMTLAKTPKQQAFVRFLQAIADMTQDDLREALDGCPTAVVTGLERGPKGNRFACGVCDAFGRAFYGSGEYDPADPMWRAWGYHEIPKLQMRHRDHLHYGEHSNHTYRRTIATYRAAGWTGEAPEPNA